MTIDDDFLGKVKDLGSLGYPLEKCMNVLQLTQADRVTFENDFKNKESDIAKWYQIGIDIADFEVDTKLFALSKSGDLNAMKELDKRKRKYLL